MRKNVKRIISYVMAIAIAFTMTVVTGTGAYTAKAYVNSGYWQFVKKIEKDAESSNPYKSSTGFDKNTGKMILSF